ncbi:hypothetical protein Tsubulata_038056, partial [Turnera subulata]
QCLVPIIATSKPPYTPDTVIFMNCGSSNDTSGDERKWVGDLNSSSNNFALTETSPNRTSSSSVAAKASVQDSGAVEPVPYMTARISRSSFTYTFNNVTPGHKFIRLHFYPASYPPSFNRSKAFFDVTAGPFTLLRNFSASLYADAWRQPTFFKEYCLNVEEETQQLNLTFTPTRSNSTTGSNDSFAFINGIEIVSMPTNLYYNAKSQVSNNTALEMICRLNVGGNSMSPTSDTGMYRLWTSDEDYYSQSDYGVRPRYPNISLNYSRIPPYTAPDDVYSSAASLGSSRTNNLRSNLTWIVAVDQGYRHLVRLHFCEIVPEVLNVTYRVFTVYIDGEAAEVGFDVFRISGGRNIPIYRDYILTTGKKGDSGDYWLYITLKPSDDSVYADVILNGLEVLKLSDPDGSLVAPNLNVTEEPPAPAATPHVPPPSPPNKKKRIKLLISVCVSVLCLLLILPLLSCVAVWQLRKRKYYNSASFHDLFTSCCWSDQGRSSRAKASSLPDELCRHFSLAEIKAATNNFHRDLIIGVGGFGNVYKGYIDETPVPVAIKRLKQGSSQGFNEFKTEIEMLSKLRHAHLVSLIGYCIDRGEMILVYEYISNGTLQDHLYGSNNNDNDPLPWKTRLKICIGAAKGFDYLHTGVANKIIHRDVKTTNILIDENWVAKVSDFGMSRIGLSDAAVSTIVKGTVGYLDPEYARLQQLTEKSDVYSFGVVLFEVLCGRKPIDLKLPDEQRSLAYWTRQCIRNGTIHQIIDPYLMGRISPECFNKFVEIAESCLREQGSQRPSMHDVMENLEFALELQEEADAKMEKDPGGGEGGGGECFYPEASFHAPKLESMTSSFTLRLLPLLSLLVSVFAATQNPQSYTLTELILLNCGESSALPSDDDRSWDGDANSKFLDTKSQNASSSSTAFKQSSVTQVPYMTARITHSKLTYSFPVSPGPKFVRLYFYPDTYSGLDTSSSFFNVTANSYTLLSNFSAYLAVSAIQPPATYFVREFIVPVWDKQELSITFMASQSSFAFINGIEIVSMPDNLYTRPAVLVGSNGNSFEFNNITSLETVYRLNVGGGPVPGLADAVMFRTWIDDQEYIFGGGLGVVHTGVDAEIKYTNETPAYIAPAVVYQTKRTMGSEPLVNLQYNLTWLFSVDPGFRYLLRFHFCETEVEITGGGQRPFIIFVNNMTADKADVFHWSGGLDIPVYRDYVVSVPRGGQKQDLWVALHPETDFESRYKDAILNGLEIFKLNNSEGNLAGLNTEAPPPQREQKPRLDDRKKGSTSVPMVAGIAGGVTAAVVALFLCLFVAKRQKRVKDLDKTEAKLSRSPLGTLDQIMDKTLKDEVASVSLKKFTEIAYHCLHKQGMERPKMGDVVGALEFALQLQKTAEEHIDMGEIEDARPLMQRGEVTTTDDDDGPFSGSGGPQSNSRSTISSLDITGSEKVFSEILNPDGR